MNWWVKKSCISAVIVKTASRNVAFKATRLRDSIMEGQDKFIMRELDNADVGLREDCEEDLVDVGCNADLYVANQESTDSISCMWGMLCSPLMGQVKIYFSFARLVLTKHT